MQIRLDDLSDPRVHALLREHLTQAAGRAPPFVYLYVSSHGRDGLAPEDVPEDRAQST